jgi:hypothetical protein
MITLCQTGTWSKQCTVDFAVLTLGLVTPPPLVTHFCVLLLRLELQLDVEQQDLGVGETLGLLLKTLK